MSLYRRAVSTSNQIVRVLSNLVLVTHMSEELCLAADAFDTNDPKGIGGIDAAV